MAAIFPHSAFSFTILAILSLLQVKCQGKDKTPFDSHPRTVPLATASLLIYGFAYGIQLGLPSAPDNRSYRIVLSETVHFCMFWAGSLSIAATASFLFPDSVSPFLFLFYFITSASALLYRVYKRFNREHQEPGNGWWGRMIASFHEHLHAAFINTRFRISHLFQPDQSPAAIFPQAAFSFTILAILDLLQAKYQGKDKTPFDSHPKTISLAITCLLIYGVAYGIQLRLSPAPGNRSYRIVLISETVHLCMFWAGSLSIAATASFLFPDSVRPFLFLLCFITSAGALLYRVYKRLNKEHRESGNGWWLRSQRLFVTTWQHLADCFTEHRQILPLVTRDLLS